MSRPKQHRRWLGGADRWTRIAPYGLTLLVILLGTQLHAQTFTVLHSFNSRTDNGTPLSGVTIDAHGNLYGALTGAVYKLTRRGSGWIYSTLYRGGDYIISRVVIGPDGTVYGAGAEGGPQNAGSVFSLRPPPTFCTSVDCPWQLTRLHVFSGQNDGGFPTSLIFDSAGNLYGTALYGGSANAGLVFKLTPDQGTWTFSVSTDFAGTAVALPYNGVTFDQNGNLYGTTLSDGQGQIYEVTNSGQVKLLYQFRCCQQGVDTDSGLILDTQGNLYGSTFASGPNGAGTVYQLSPSDGGWTLNTLYGFGDGGGGNGLVIGTANLLMDAQENLYGTSVAANQYGVVFKLAPSANGWVYTLLHQFTGGDDGCYPWDGLAMDSAGNLYGTAYECGQYGGYEQGGTLWEITP